MDRSSLIAEIREIGKGFWHRVGTHWGFFSWSFGKYKGKIYLSNGKLLDLVSLMESEDLSFQEFAFFFKIVSMAEFDYDFQRSCTVRVTYGNMKGFCSKNTFANYKQKLVDGDLIIPTSNRNYFVLNPEHAHKFYKTRINMTPEEFSDYKERKQR